MKNLKNEYPSLHLTVLIEHSNRKGETVPEGRPIQVITEEDRVQYAKSGFRVIHGKRVANSESKFVPYKNVKEQAQNIQIMELKIFQQEEWVYFL